MTRPASTGLAWLAGTRGRAAGETRPPRSETLLLLRPKLLGSLGRRRLDRARAARVVLVSATAGAAGALLYGLSLRLLETLREVPEIGPLLASKLLALALLLFFCILVLSNVIGALSSFFLARDLPGLLSAPVDWLPLYGARLAETVASSSWMVVLLMAPVLAAYRTVYAADPAFYGVAAAAVLPFLVIPAAAGSAITLLLVRVVPARRTRDLLAVVAGAAAALLVLGLRVLRPERLVRPDGFRNLVDFLDTLRGPSSVWLPSEWAADAMTGFLESGFDPFPLLLLWSTAAAVVVLGAWVHRRLYARGFTRAQEGAGGRSRADAPWRRLERALRRLGPERVSLVTKDLRVFFRDSTQWSQLLVLAVLMVVYLYNVRVLPLHTAEGIGRFLVTAVALLNLGLAGFVLAAVAARFVFPAPSLEGRALWLLRSSPLSPASLLWSKYWTAVLPLLVLAVVLVAATDLLLGVHRALLLLSLVSIVGLAFALTAQALAWGTAFPKLESENPAQIPTSTGGLLFMAGGIATLIAVLAAQVWLLRGYILGGLPGRALRGIQAEELVLALAATVLICALATVLPYAEARRRIGRLGGD